MKNLYEKSNFPQRIWLLLAAFLTSAGWFSPLDKPTKVDFYD